MTKKYNFRLAGAALIGVGAFLSAEHAYAWGWDLSFGHEWIGLCLIGAGAVSAYVSKWFE
ncbi:MAG: hypothetical protein KAT83_01270 [Candidatus Aenigmarchaeota archaeon]|nr:hypothetical protein [Candidatus Aenigmarchaeota archaeon]